MLSLELFNMAAIRLAGRLTKFCMLHGNFLTNLLLDEGSMLHSLAKEITYYFLRNSAKLGGWKM
jgi:hypothetical protein